MPEISLIIPVYNGERFVEHLSRSIYSQTYKDFEIIIVDDGSKDNSYAQIIKWFGNSEYQVKVLIQENKGVSSARNYGLNVAQGNYVCFVDCDDLIHPRYLELLIDAIYQTNCNIALGYMTRYEHDFEKAIQPATKMDIDVFLYDYLFYGSKYQIPTAIFKKSIIDTHKLTFREGEKYGEDVHFTWRAFATQENVAITPNFIYCYCDRPGSATNTLNPERIRAINLIKELEPYMQERRSSFYPIFKQYAVARQYWSLLWRAAITFKKYSAFINYISNFNMDENLKKLKNAPDRKVAISSRIFCASPFLYYKFIRLYFTLNRRIL